MNSRMQTAVLPRTALWLAALMSATLGAAAGPDDPAASGDAVELEPIIIQAPVSPLDAELWRLRLLLDATTPCLGCDARTVPTRENLLTGLIRFVLLPAEPPPVDQAGRTLSAVRCDQAGPESEFRCP